MRLTSKERRYSQEECWVNFPEITKDVDTFYIYSTQYMGQEKGDPNYASLDNPDMVVGALGEFVTNATAYEDATNVFAPLLSPGQHAVWE